MILPEVISHVEDWARKQNVRWEVDHVTHEFTFWRPMKIHLSRGIENGKRNYTLSSIDEALNIVKEKL